MPNLRTRRRGPPCSRPAAFYSRASRALPASYRVRSPESILAYNPWDDIRVPKRHKQDTDEQLIARDVFRESSCLPCPTATAAWSPSPVGPDSAGERRPDSAPTPWT